MNSAHRERVKELLSRAARLAPQERVDFILREGGTEREIVAEAIDLLATLDDSQFMSAPTGAGLAAAIPGTTVKGEVPGTRIGRYKLLQLIGEGGFGSVFLAEQFDPVQRKVALKIIKAGMDTKQVIARFEAERQAIAMMDHPNIARVFDAGATESGRPFFVMELVRGEPLTRFCDREQLAVRQRLELFRDVCHAVQHAHQKGIIHRDLKPSNVLVTVADGVPLPKVIDFGIAKATSTRLTEKTLFTEMHQLIGTPEYMSPEQAEVSGIDIDTRSDIYSLGVLLYELLVGSTPLEAARLRHTPLSEVQRLIREEEAQRPSLRIATRSSSIGTSPFAREQGSDSSALDIAKKRRSEPQLLTRLLRGDLDWIVMKCLEKDRLRRYVTAAALADDVGRYLADQPVLATPPSSGDRLRKLMRRNRRAVVAGAVVATILLIASGVSFAFALSAVRQRAVAEAARDRAKRAEHEAQVRADELEKVARFQQAQLSILDPQAMGGRLREGLLQNVRLVAEHGAILPSEVQDRVNHVESLLAGIEFTNLALDMLEESFFEPAFRAVERQFRDQPLVKASLLQSSADSLHKLGRYEAALKPQEECLAIRREALGESHSDTLESLGKLGFLFHSLGRHEDAQRTIEEALRLGRGVLDEDHPEVAEWTNNLGLVLQARGDLKNAERYYRDALERRRRTLGSDHLDTINSLNNVGYFLQAKGRFDEAEPYLREALEKYRRNFGDEHAGTLTAINNLGALLFVQGRVPEAEPYFREAIDTSRRVLGSDHRDTLRALDNMSVVLRSLGRVSDSEVHCRESFERYRRVYGEDYPDTIISMSNLGVVVGALDRDSEAESLLRSALERSQRVLGKDNPNTLRTSYNLAFILEKQGQARDAETLYRECVEGRRHVLGEEHPDTLIGVSTLGNLYLRQRKDAEALALLEPAEAASRRVFVGGNDFYLGRLLYVLGRARARSGDFYTAQSNLTEALTIANRAKGATKQDGIEARKGLIELYELWSNAASDPALRAEAESWRAQLRESGDGE